MAAQQLTTLHDQDYHSLMDFAPEVPEGGYAGCPWDPKKAPRAWWCWNIAEYLGRQGVPVVFREDAGLIPEVA